MGNKLAISITNNDVINNNIENNDIENNFGSMKNINIDNKDYIEKIEYNNKLHNISYKGSYYETYSKYYSDTYNNPYNELYYQIHNNKILNSVKDIKNDDNNKKRTFILNKYIKGIVYKNKNEYGDFEWMIRSKNYNKTLFIFDDNIEYYNTSIKGDGIQKIREYNEFSNNFNINSAGIIMAESEGNGFIELNDKNKMMIDLSFENIKNLIIRYGYNSLYYKCNEDNGEIFTDLYYLDNNITKYVMEKMNKLYFVFEKV